MDQKLRENAPLDWMLCLLNISQVTSVQHETDVDRLLVGSIESVLFNNFPMTDLWKKVHMLCILIQPRWVQNKTKTWKPNKDNHFITSIFLHLRWQQLRGKCHSQYSLGICSAHTCDPRLSSSGPWWGSAHAYPRCSNLSHISIGGPTLPQRLCGYKLYQPDRRRVPHRGQSHVPRGVDFH